MVLSVGASTPTTAAPVTLDDRRSQPGAEVTTIMASAHFSTETSVDRRGIDWAWQFLADEGLVPRNPKRRVVTTRMLVKIAKRIDRDEERISEAIYDRADW